MNRAERRRVKNRFKAQNIFLEKGKDTHNTKDDLYCHRHPLKLEDPDHPTERDKQLIKSVTFDNKKIVQEDGTVRLFKQCPRCFQTIEIDVIKRALLA